MAPNGSSLGKKKSCSPNIGLHFVVADWFTAACPAKVKGMGTWRAGARTVKRRGSAEPSVEALAPFRRRGVQKGWPAVPQKLLWKVWRPSAERLPQNLPGKSWRLPRKGSSDGADGASAKGGAGSSWVTQKTLAGR